MSLFLLLRPLGATTPYATLTAGPFTEAQIRAGGQTITIDLSNDTWVAVGPFAAERQNIINGLVSAQAEAFGWNAVVQATQTVAGVVRASNTQVVITLDAFAAYNITANETITVTIPATAVTSAGAMVAGTFDVTAEPVVVVSSQISGVKRKPVRIRRADFSSQKNYEFALRAALLGATSGIVEDDEPPVVKPRPKPKLVVTDTNIKVSAKAMAELQRLAEVDEVKMLEYFVKIIDEEWD